MTLDWIAAVANVIGLYALPKRRMVGMSFFVISSITFGVWAWSEEVWSLVALQTILLILNIRTILIWKNLP